jgi:energy-coupling factor transporter ATP-binding protein EcfA2
LTSEVQPAEASAETPVALDPRVLLAQWANENDEWVRQVVAEVLSSGRALTNEAVDNAYALFRQEKAFDERTVPVVPYLATEAAPDEQAPPLTITRLSGVRGVNALTLGAVIEPHAGLTILYGENGTGKTGYSRIFKALADSRTADEILGDIEASDDDPPAAKLEYRLGDQDLVLEWAGERGLAPFTRLSIFDSPSVTFHVDDDLEYVYVPAALAQFSHVVSGIQGVAARVNEAIADLESGSASLLSRFPKEAKVYPLIETLGASTDLVALKAMASTDPKVDETIESLRQAVAALDANTLGPQITLRQREVRVLEQAAAVAAGLWAFDLAAYNDAIANRAELDADYEAFRSEMFAAADLPAEPDETWSAFVRAGGAYRQQLVDAGVHDTARCLYCRQTLDDPARELLTKYAAYLDDRISADLREVVRRLDALAQSAGTLSSPDVTTYLAEYAEREDKPVFYGALSKIDRCREDFAIGVATRSAIEPAVMEALRDPTEVVSQALATTLEGRNALQEQQNNRVDTLAQKRTELAELVAAAELARSWPAIESQVANAKDADRLKKLRSGFGALARGVTSLSKTASDQLINQSFDALFAEECASLRAPSLKVQFVGREGKAQRRKVLSGKYRPSKVLSEGEQKVLAIADFLAEARLAGITAPVIFDDPVSSLDHRRINEVAQRIANLAETNQVIVFTHDIFFATTLLVLFERSKRCSYFQITDEAGKGRVTRATGPRWDTLSEIKKKINTTIEAAKKHDGEARDALVRTGYDWIRSWCEVFTESELLRGVTQRYQPNVGMTKLPQINTDRLPELVPRVTAAFEEACRYIDGHSQPLPTLGVSPTLAGLEQHWSELQECKRINDGK